MAAPVAGRQLFIGNLPFSVTTDALRDLIEQNAGPVVRAEVHASANGRSKGFGTALFNTVEEAQHAIESLNGYDFQGRRIELREDRAASGNNGAFGSRFANNNAGNRGPAAAAVRQGPAGTIGQNLASMPAATSAPATTGIAVSGGGIQTPDYIRTWHEGPSSAADQVAANGKPNGGAVAAEGAWQIDPLTPATVAAAADGSWSAEAVPSPLGSAAAPVAPAADPQDGPSHQLFVGNLPFTTVWQDIKTLFREAGEVLNVDMPRHPFHQRSRGFAIVLMDSPESARKAISMFHELEFNGRVMLVRFDRMASGEFAGKFRQSDSRNHRNHQSQQYHSQQQQHSQPQQQPQQQPPQQQQQQPHQYQVGADVPAEINVHVDGEAHVDAEVPENGVASNAAAAAPAADGPQLNRRLYIGNIPFSTSWQDLKDLFRTVGQVSHAEIVIGPQGRSRGFGIVVMATPEDAAEAIRSLQSYELDGRSLEVRHDRMVPQPITPGTQLYIGNLPYTFRWQDLKDLFRNAHNPTHADIPFDSTTGRSRGYGTVRFNTVEEANRALELDGMEIGGRSISVHIDKFNPVA